MIMLLVLLVLTCVASVDSVASHPSAMTPCAEEWGGGPKSSASKGFDALSINAMSQPYAAGWLPPHPLMSSMSGRALLRTVLVVIGVV